MDIITKLPNPYELFTKMNESSKQIDKDSDKENFTSAPSTTPTKDSSSIPNSTTKKQPKYFVFLLMSIFIILFFILAFMYYVYEITILPSILSTDYTAEKREPQTLPLFSKVINNQFTSGRLSIFICVWIVIYLLNILIGDIIFHKSESLNIFYLTTIFVFGIVGTTFIIIGNIPSLVEVFENTFGYYLINSFLYKLKNLMKIFKSKYFPNFDIPYEILITRFDIPSFHDTLNSLIETNDNPKENPLTDELSNDFYVDFKSVDKEIVDIKNGLLKMVFVKNNAGHFTWIYIASVVSVLLTMNTITKNT